MIQALIATIIEVVALVFAVAAGAFLEDKTDKKRNGKVVTCIVLSLLLAACALGVAAR